MNAGYDVSFLMPNMVKMMANSNLVVKKMAYHFLTISARNSPDLIVLAINTLLKDATDSNPMVRGLAIKTLCSLKQESCVDQGAKVVKNGMDDRSAYVRRVSVLSCVKVYSQNPQLVLEEGYIDKLYAMIRDSDPIVVVNCLLALEEILQHEGGVALNKNIVNHILNRIGEFTPWGQAYIFEIFKKYNPQNEDEIFNIMNLLDKYLGHNNTALTLSCLQLFHHLTADLPHIRSDVFNRSSDTLLATLASSNHELIFTILCYLNEILDDVRDNLSIHFKTFFCKHKEPVYLKTKKIELLPKLVNEQNVDDILEELGLNCVDKSSDISFAAVTAIGTLATNKPECFNMCINKLKGLIELNLSKVTSNVLKVIQNIDLSHCDDKQELVRTICAKSDIITDDQGKCAVLWLIGQLGSDVAEVPYILDEYIGNIDDVNLTVKFNLLTATVKTFFDRPGECQDMLGMLLEHCITGQKDNELQSRAKFYYNLLKTSVIEAKTVICGTS